MKVIIYGIGKRYAELCGEFGKYEIEIIGFADGNKDIRGSQVLYGEKAFEVKNIRQFDRTEYDKILVTTKKFYAEIEEQLLQEGFEKENILLADSLLNDLLADQIYHIQYFENKAWLEIGGPSDLFSHIYHKCAACDGINFCLHTAWGETETGAFRYGKELLG